MRGSAWKERVASVLPPRAEDLELVDLASRALRAPLDARRRRQLAAGLRSGVSRVETLVTVATSPERAADLAEHYGPPGVDDLAFVHGLFGEVLGRTPDPAGEESMLAAIRDGRTRAELAASVLGSVEARQREHTVVEALSRLPDLIGREPGRYEQAVSTGGGRPAPALRIRSGDDIDWVERQILDHGYYEVPNVWTGEVDADKQVLGQIVATFGPSRALELGCGSGAVLSVLQDLGVEAEGVDISASARADAPVELRDRIHLGDLLEVRLEPGYDVICGFDVFEHLNPGRLDRYLRTIAGLLEDEGFVVANIPAYGDDEVFGRAFPPELVGWEERDGLYDLWPVDPCGFPHHGHLVWATGAWWVARFADAGLTRLPDVERAIQGRYGAWIAASAPARRTMFVFGKDASSARADAVIAAVPDVRSLGGV